MNVKWYQAHSKDFRILSLIPRLVKALRPVANPVVEPPFAGSPTYAVTTKGIDQPEGAEKPRIVRTVEASHSHIPLSKRYLSRIDSCPSTKKRDVDLVQML